MTEELTMPYENKAIALPETRMTLDDMHRTFHDYTQTNDERLKALEHGRGDVLLDEKLSRMDRRLDDLSRKMERSTVAALRAPRGSSGSEFVDHEHKAAIDSYIRTGATEAINAIEKKALSAGSGPDGGFLITPAAEREILMRMAIISPMRAIASVRAISTGTYKKAFSTTGPQAGWVTETAARPQTNSQILAELTFPAMELYAMPSATRTMLDDAAIDSEQWIASEIETVFAEQEGSAFINGDGITRPQGLLQPAKVAAASWSWGRLAYHITGAAGAFPAANPADVLIDLIYGVRSGYRQNAKFLMNRRTQAVIRKFKTTTGEYLWQPPNGAGDNATILNFAVIDAEDMPNIGADTFPIAFGDFARGYLIVDRIGVRILRDPYSAKPYILYYTTKRVGGGIQDFDAIKLLKMGIS